jgi:hypothetical protein
MPQLKIGNLVLFPANRFDPDFPLPIWFAGLWFYLKSFLYLCYIYMLGLEPAPYPSGAIFEVLYFGFTMMPAFCLGLLLWNRRERYTLPAILFLVIDTPVLLYHVWRLGRLGYLETTLTKGVEFGSLGLNVMALVWLINYVLSKRVEALSRQPK